MFQKKIPVEIEVLEFTELPQEIMDLLGDRKITPDFSCVVTVNTMIAFAIHVQEDDRCMVLVFTYAHGMVWQMMLSSQKAHKLHNIISTFVHEELPGFEGEE